jgi:DNA-3-methyladenine glycosylase
MSKSDESTPFQYSPLQPLARAFFARETCLVAEQLIGCYLVRHLPNIADSPLVVRITETEAYKGEEDAASHAFRGPTARNQVMFDTPGKLYVYFTYGMHYCMNIVTEAPGIAGAVLIRAAEPIHGIATIRQFRSNKTIPHDRDLLNGPAKLTQALAIDLSFNGLDLITNENRPADSAIAQISLCQPLAHDIPPAIERTPRIGISKATELLWRYKKSP